MTEILDISGAFEAIEPTPRPMAQAPVSRGQLFEAAQTVARPDRMDGEQLRIREGYQPIVDALNRGRAPRERFDNPGNWEEDVLVRRPLFERSQFDFLSILSDERVTRGEAEQRIFAEIQRRRAAEPGFLPDVPKTLAEFRQGLIDQTNARTDAAAAVLARGDGILDTLAGFAGGVVETMKDPVNIASLPLGGGGKTIAAQILRNALVNAGLEAVQQPIVAERRADLGRELTFGEAAQNVGMAFAGSLAIEGGVRYGARFAGNGYDRTIEAIFEAMPPDVQRKWADKMTLDGKPLAEAVRTTIGEDRLTPAERSALNVLERETELAESSPYESSVAGDEVHGAKIAASIEGILRNRPVDVDPPAGPAIARGATASDPAGSPAPAVARAVGANRDRPVITRGGAALEVDQFKRLVRGAESDGDDLAAAATSSAFGRYQFTKDTWRKLYARVFGKSGLSDREILAKRADPAAQERLMDELTADNTALLQRAGQPVTAGNLYLVHFLGPDAARVLRADPATPVERLVAAESVAANKSVLEGKSASQVIAWAHRKMGGSAAAVEARPGLATGGALEGAEDAMVAQLRNEAFELQNRALAATEDLPAMAQSRYRPGDLLVDAKTFQFKSGGDEFGVSDRLAGVTEWNPIYAGHLVVWERADGTRFVADGHQRSGLARRIEAETGAEIWLDAITLREADGVTAQDARVWAALKNIAEGTGTAVDAGEDVLADLPPKSPLVRDGKALARLSDEAFGAVYNGLLPADIAAVIGHLLPDNPDAHAGLVDLLVKLDPANRGQAESIVRQAIAAGFHKETQDELFGVREVTAPLFLERAKVLERGLAQLRKLKLVYGTAAKEAGTLERVGSRIARSKTEKEAARNAEALEIVARLAFSRGPIADALNDAAAKLAAGGQLGRVVAEFVDAVRGLDLRAAGKDAASDGADRLAPDGAGRGGDAGAADDALQAQSGDPGQPSLSAAADQPGFLPGDEAAAARFDDPDGPAAKAQAESLEHDLRMGIAAEPVHPSTGETLAHAKARAIALRDSFEVAEANGSAGTHNLPNSAPIADGRTRGELRDAIVADMLARPARQEREAHLVLGPPAAGKSSMAEPLAAARGARIIDSDDAKAALPEFEDGIGAMAVHEESALLAAAAADASIARGDNILLPLVGKTYEGVAARVADLEKAGYQVYVHLVDLPGDEAVKRAIARFQSSGRLVDPDYVASVGNKPLESFERLIAEHGDKLGGYIHVSNDVPKGQSPRIVRSSSDELADGLGFARAERPGEAPPASPGAPASPGRGSRADGLPRLNSGAAPIALDLGARADPAIADRNRQLAELGAAAPLRDAANQDGTMGLGLFDAADQPTFRLDVGGDERAADDILAELDRDAAAIEAIRACMPAPKGLAA